jgi:outer membrane receptor protein involved in Fe transport
VVVRAARLPPAAGDAAFSIIRIEPRALASNERLDVALATAPGFSLYRRTSSLGANPTTQGVSLRGIAGSGASRALVTLDGVPQNDPFGGWVIWTGLPAEAVADASIVRGAGAGPYGAGALTGVVALETPEQIERPGSGEVSAGERGYARAAGITALNFGRTRLFLDASTEHSDGWIPVIRGRGAADRPLALRDWSAAERTETDLGLAVLSERIAAYQEDRVAGTLYANSRARGVQASLALVAPPSGGDLGWRLQAWVDGSDLANTSASVSPDRNTATLADNQYATPALGVGLNAALRFAVADYGWEIGLDVRDFDGESRERLYNQGNPTGSRISGGGELVAGIYAEASRRFGRWLVTGGVRLDDWEDYGSKLIQTGLTVIDQHPGDRGGQVPTGRVGLRRDLAGGVYARTAAYAGFRPATLNELHRSFRVGNDVTEANAALSPERLYGAEFGVGGAGGVNWDADVFFNQLANAVTNVTIGKGPVTFPIAGFVPAGGTLYLRENAGTVNAVGVEGEASHPFGPNLNLRVGFAYTHAWVDGGAQAPQLTGKRPAETPDLTVTADAEWRPLKRLTLVGQLRYESDRFDDDLNTRRIDGGAEVDARAEWRLAGDVSVYLAADNLFDAALETGRSAANVVTYAAPRTVHVGFILKR